LRLKDFELGDGWIDFTVQTLQPGELSSAIESMPQSADR